VVRSGPEANDKAEATIESKDDDVGHLHIATGAKWLCQNLSLGESVVDAVYSEPVSDDIRCKQGKEQAIPLLGPT
jgi:hypothetical protein